MMSGRTFVKHPVPPSVGIGLRAPHYRELVETQPAVGWLEVHSENYFGPGGKPLQYLELLREHYPLSLHGVGLSLGSVDPIDGAHLRSLKALMDRFEPGLISEHLCWNSVGGQHLHDLLPLPFTEEALAHVCDRIDAVQSFLGRTILIENISSYMQFAHSDMQEVDFISAVAQKTACGILLDINNIYVNTTNYGGDAVAFIDSVPINSVREIHLAGFDHYSDTGFLIDTHGTRVSDAVWALYRHAIRRFGPVPTLIEWDTDIPPFAVLLDEAMTASNIMEASHARAA